MARDSEFWSLFLCVKNPLYFPTQNILFFYDLIYLFLEKGEWREKERERTSMWETLISCLLHIPWLGTKPTTQAHSLTRDRTGNLSHYEMMPNQLSHTGQGPTENILDDGDCFMLG